MNLATTVYAVLSGYAGLAALVGTRVYPSIAQAQSIYPYVVYSTVFNAPQNSLGGWSGGDNIRLQIDCWAQTYADANNLADQVRAAMAQPSSAYRGLCISVLDGPVESGLGLYHVIVEFSLWTT